jgi:hypothetical protein
MTKFLVIVALVAAVIATLLGFEIVTVDGDPYVLGWLSLSLGLYLASLVVPND